MSFVSGVWRGAVFAVMSTGVHGQGGVSAQAQPELGGPTAASVAHSVHIAAGVQVPRLTAIEIQGEQPGMLPAGSERLSRSQLDDRDIDSWEDLSRRGNAGVGFSRASDSVNVRGMDRDRVVTRVDGIRVPWLTDGSRGEEGGLSAIDFSSLSSVDLVRGAGATASGTLTGYLDLHTLQPDDLLVPGQDFGALLKSGYDSADDGWDAHAALAGRFTNEDTKWLLQAGLRRAHELDNQGEAGGYGAARGQRNPETNRQHNVLLKLQHDWDSVHRLTLSGESFRLHRDIDNRLEQGAGTSYPEANNQTISELTRQRVWAGYGFRSSAERAPLEHADIKLYWQQTELEGRQDAFRNPDRRGSVSFGPFPVGRVYGYAYPYGPYGRSNVVSERGHGVVADWGGTLTGAGMLHSWSMGAEWYASRSEQSSTGYDNCPDTLLPVPPAYSLGPRNCEFLHTNLADVASSKGTQYALWFQDEISWGAGRYAVIPAVRYDHYRYRPQADGGFESNPNAELAALSSNSAGRLSPSLLLKMQAAEDLMLYAKYGYGFKAPSSTQLYMNYGVPGTYLRVGNPSLRPEVSRGWELGLEYGNARRGMQFAIFDNRYRDFIDENVALTPDSAEWNPAWDGMYPLGVTAYANRSRVRIYGAELGGHWEFDRHWYGWSSVAWARGRDQDTSQYINSVAPLKAIVAVGYRRAQWGAEAIGTLVRHRDEVAEPETDFQAPGFGLLDLTAWWKPESIKGVKLRAGVYNVFDKKYWNALNVRAGAGRMADAPIDYYTEPGRSVRISLSYQY